MEQIRQSFEELTVRTRNALRSANIDVHALKTGKICANELKRLPNLGRISVNEIRYFLADMGYTLKDERDIELINRAKEKSNNNHASSAWNKLQLTILYSCRKTFHETIDEINKKETSSLSELYDALESHKRIVEIYMDSILNVRETYEDNRKENNDTTTNQ